MSFHFFNSYSLAYEIVVGMEFQPYLEKGWKSDLFEGTYFLKEKRKVKKNEETTPDSIPRVCFSEILVINKIFLIELDNSHLINSQRSTTVQMSLFSSPVIICKLLQIGTFFRLEKKIGL